MRALCLIIVFAAAQCFAKQTRDKTPSPNGRWVVVSQCDEDTREPDSCSIVLSRRADGKVFFTHHTFPRYIKAVWSSDSTRCVLLDAPDNANSYLWLFRIKGREVATEKLDYGRISRDIEAAIPATHRKEPDLTRSGVEKLEWISASKLRLHIIYNNTSVVVVADVAEPTSPKFRVLPHNET